MAPLKLNDGVLADFEAKLALYGTFLLILHCKDKRTQADFSTESRSRIVRET